MRTVNLQRRRECVENTYPLDTRPMLHHANLERRPRTVSTLNFSDGASVAVDVCAVTETTIEISFDLCPFTFAPSVPRDDQNPQHLQVLRVRALAQNFGEKRFFVICPDCDCSANILYLPRGANRFACRRCFGLAYEVQTLHRTRHAAMLAETAGSWEAFRAQTLAR